MSTELAPFRNTARNVSVYCRLPAIASININTPLVKQNQVDMKMAVAGGMYETTSVIRLAYRRALIKEVKSPYIAS